MKVYHLTNNNFDEFWIIWKRIITIHEATIIELFVQTHFFAIRFSLLGHVLLLMWQLSLEWSSAAVEIPQFHFQDFSFYPHFCTNFCRDINIFETFLLSSFVFLRITFASFSLFSFTNTGGDLFYVYTQRFIYTFY